MVLPIQTPFCTRSAVHADETPMRILDTRKGGTSRQGYLWSYVSGEHTGNPVVVFECQAGRGAKYPLAFLSEWTGGYLVSDDYDAYCVFRSVRSRVRMEHRSGVRIHSIIPGP